MLTVPAERAKAIGIWSGVTGLGVAIGPTLGGWLHEHFSWGSIFMVNLPIVAVALVDQAMLGAMAAAALGFVVVARFLPARATTEVTNPAAGAAGTSLELAAVEAA